MKKVMYILAVSFMFLTLNLSAATKEEQKVLDAVEVLQEAMSIPEKQIPPLLFKKAYAIAIIPQVYKAGFVVGGRYGKGVLSIQGKNGWSNPAFITLAGGSLGWQIGAQATDVVLVFKNRRSIDGIVSGKFTLGADAAIAAGPIGRQAEAGTDLFLQSEIYSYSRSKGFFAGVSLEGSVLQIDDEANRNFYQTNTSATDIFRNYGVHAPAVTSRLKNVLQKYTR